MKFLVPLSLVCLCLAGLPARAEEEPAPVGAERPQPEAVIAARQADMDADRQDAKCRVAKTVEMGIAFGGGQVRRQVGARLDYGQDVAGLPAGVALPPCPTNGIAMSLAVSSSDGGFGRVSQGNPSQGQGSFPPSGRGSGRGPGGGPPAR
jgi:hypothetical protein